VSTYGQDETIGEGWREGEAKWGSGSEDVITVAIQSGEPLRFRRSPKNVLPRALKTVSPAGNPNSVLPGPGWYNPASLYGATELLRIPAYPASAGAE
jgi:hypothetical protein